MSNPNTCFCSLGNHWGVGKRISKIDMCNEIGARIIVDDSLKYVFECAPNLDQVRVVFCHGEVSEIKCLLSANACDQWMLNALFDVNKP